MFKFLKANKKTTAVEPDYLDAYIENQGMVFQEDSDEIGVTPTLKNNFIKKIKSEEGCELLPYKCEENYLTIGFGRNIETNGIRQSEADFMLENDIETVFFDLDRNIPMWKFEPMNIKIVLCDMCYNLGIKKLLGFKLLLEAIDEADYETASREILDSKYANQVPNRAKRNALLCLEEV